MLYIKYMYLAVNSIAHLNSVRKEVARIELRTGISCSCTARKLFRIYEFKINNSCSQILFNFYR